MATDTKVPVNVLPEAEEYVRRLGLQDPFEQMIDHALQVVPGLRRIEASIQPVYDLGGEPVVLIDVYKDDSHEEDDPTNRELSSWKVRTFPPEVFLHFTFLICYV